MAKKKHISILIRILLWITVAITAIYLVSAFIGYADPRKCGFLSIAGLAYPITLLITLALTVALLIIHKKYALIPAAAFRKRCGNEFSNLLQEPLREHRAAAWVYPLPNESVIASAGNSSYWIPKKAPILRSL